MRTKLIETDRLILRKLELSDAEDMYNNYCSSDNVTKYLSWGTHSSLSDTKAYLENIALPRYENEDAYMWAVVLKETNELIGCIDVNHYDLKKKSACFGWVLSEKYWGRGLMPEAAIAVRDYLFNEGFIRLWAYHYVGNEKSGRVMQKMGMVHEGTLHKYAFNNQGELVDVEIYAITK